MADNTEPTGQPPLSRVPRRNPGHEPAADPAHLTQLANLMDSVKVLAAHLGSAPADTADTASDRAVRRTKKFQRSGTTDERRADAPANEPAAVTDKLPADPAAKGEAASLEEAAEPPEAVDPTALNKSIAWPRLARDGTAAAAVRPKRRKRSTTAPLLVLMACNVVVLILGYLFGQAAAGGVPPKDGATATPGQNAVPADPLASQNLSDQALDVANTGIRAEKTGDIVTARRTYDDAIQQRVALPGAEYRLALLAIRRGDLLDADLHLIHSTNAGEYVAACYYVRSTFAGAKGNYAEASRQLEAAARSEPFNARYRFFWGESLRRQGKPHAAVTCLGQALDRGYDPEEGDLYLFKLGMAKVELGDDQEFNKWLDDHLKQTNVPGDTLLLAAAQALQHSNFKQAADDLQKAEGVMPPALFAARVRDYLFQTQVKQPDLAPFLNHPVAAQASEAGASVMDPSSWTAEKADPGTWPNAAASGS